MSRYYTDKSYIYYPDSDVPINKYNIQDKEIVAETERTLLFISYQNFHKSLTQDTIFDQEYFIELHKSTFFDFYPFAGKFRNKDIGKGSSLFCKAVNIQQEMDRIFNELKHDNYLINLTKENFAKKLAYYSCELIAVHPFFECNGRIIRLYIDMIAIYNGYEYIEYPEGDEDDNPYIEASKDCMCIDTSKMYNLIYNGLHEIK